MGRGGGGGLPDSYQLHDSDSRESGAVVGAGTKMEEASEGRRGTRGETDSEDELEEVGGLCEGSRLVDLIMTTLRKTCSLLLLSPNTDVKNVSHFVSLLSLCLARHCYQHHHKHLLLSWKQKLVSIWGSSLHLDRPSGTGKKGKYQQDVPHVPVNVNSFPISHWSAAEKAPREPRANRTPRLENTDTMKEQTESTTDSAPSKKRFSLQNEVIN